VKTLQTCELSLFSQKRKNRAAPRFFFSSLVIAACTSAQDKMRSFTVALVLVTALAAGALAVR
jgi:hypothetical protein